ncbi:MAG: hypothetical protein PUH29_11405 [Lachnospiraceae bacterium]|nr:hypothetical protein [Lachnospiraceae bacterium]MDY5498331.1 hypothetical protein [Anaerobutyricum sp.]
MLEFIMGNTAFVKAIMVCCVLGIISWMVLTFSYRSMIKASGQIGKTRKKWLVSLKKKYEDYHEMDVKVNNVETFVDKCFRKKRICGLPCAFWKTFYHMMIALCAVIGAAGALAASQRGGDLSSVIITYITGVMAAVGLWFFDILLRPEEKEHRIKMNMNDYLENVLENSMEEKDGEAEGRVSREQKRRLVRYARENSRRKIKEEPVSLEEKQVLEDVLQQFFA